MGMDLFVKEVYGMSDNISPAMLPEFSTYVVKKAKNSFQENVTNSVHETYERYDTQVTNSPQRR